MTSSPLLSAILEQENLGVHFQPIISLKQKAVVGLEALARPGSVAGLAPMNILELFQAAKGAGQLVDLDRLCRRSALAKYGKMAFARNRPLLFLNFESSIIDQGVAGSGAIRKAAEDNGVEPGDIVIEINESAVNDGASLSRFVESHRDAGFLIAIDDLGTGASNLPRVAALRPHIIKLDRSLIEGIDADYFKQETFKSLVSLGHKIGCLVLAEGVETQAEVDACAALGSELFQGFNFSRPLAPELLDFEGLAPSIHAAAKRQREAAVNAIHVRGALAREIHRISDRVKNILTAADPTGFDTVLEKLVNTVDQVECAYILDRDGIQVTLTHKQPKTAPPNNRLFSPAPKGSDHSNKDYFYSLMDAGLPRYTTDAYLSLATGRFCRTIASLIQRQDGSKYALCLDLSRLD